MFGGRRSRRAASHASPTAGVAAGRTPEERRDAFEAMVREHQGALHRHVALTYPTAPTDVVVNTTFATAWQHFDEIEPPATTTWLRATARHVVFNTSRAERRFRAVPDRLVQLDPPRSTQAAPDSDARLYLDVVLRALEQLPEADQHLLRLCAADDPSNEDLAVILDCSMDTAKKRLSRARERLRAAVDELERRDPEGRTP